MNISPVVDFDTERALMAAVSSPVVVSDKVGALASRVLEVVATRIETRTDTRESRSDGGQYLMSDELLGGLCAALLRPGDDLDAGADAVGSDVAVLEAVATLRESGVKTADIADHYVPAAARWLGDLWVEDTGSFVQVTIGLARLQTLLRQLDDDLWPGHSAAPDAPAILMLVAPGSQHTFGATVVASQLRRRGYAVRVLPDARSDALRPILRHAHFDAVFISASRDVALESVRNLVKSVRTLSKGGVPVVVGGTVLQVSETIKAQTGADHVTCDPIGALVLCGLNVRPNAAPRARRS